MSGKAARRNRHHQAEDLPVQPSALSLAAYIFKALLADGMAWLTVPALAVTFFLYRHHSLNDAYLAIIFCALAVIALVRGCLNWQRDLTEYQRDLASLRHREKAETRKTIPGYFPQRRY